MHVEYKTQAKYLTDLEAARETVRTLVSSGVRTERQAIYDAAILHGVSRNELTTMVQARVQS